MRYTYIIHMLLLLLPAGPGMAQDARLEFKTIGVNDGLSQNSVNAIVQDSRGYMWLGTGDGLNCYDGSKVRSWKVADSPRAAGNSNAIRGSLCEDKKGNIWFTTETGIYCFSRQLQAITHGTVWSTDPALARYAWSELRDIDEQGNLYIVSYSNGVIQFNTATHALYHWDVVPRPAGLPEYLFSASDKKGNIWFRAGKKGVLRFSRTTHQFTPCFTSLEVIGMSFNGTKCYVSVPGRVYVTDSQLHICDSISLSGVAGSATKFVFQDGYGHPWVATNNNGLLRFDEATARFAPMADVKLANICSRPVTVFNDRNNNLWIGTDGNGVCRIDLKPARFSGFPANRDEPALLSKYFTKCIYEAPDGVVWFGTFGNGFFRLNRKTNELTGSVVAGSIVGAIDGDDRDNIWVGGNNGLFIFNGGKASHKVDLGVAPISTRDPFVSAILPAGDGSMLVATALGLFRVSIRGNKEFVVQIKTSFPRIGDLLRAADGSLWANLRVRGVQRLELINDSAVVSETIYPQSSTSCIHQDMQDTGVLWIGADRGLVRYDRRSRNMRLYNETAGLGNSHVYAILEDAQHKLWLSTNGGICSFNKQDTTVKNYTVKDGLQSNEFNTDCCFKSSSGTLYFGGINGFNWFDPSVPAHDTVAPLLDMMSVSIDDTLAGKQFWDRDSVIIMPHGRKTIRFSFAVLDYTRPEANTIMYTLGEDGDKWYEARDHVVQFASLAAGDYTLNVKAVNSAGVHSGVKKIRFTILPPFWQTGWFALAIAAAAIVVIVLVTRSVAQRKLKARLAELEKIKEIDKERLRISREMHDDIGAGLTQITLMSEMAKNRPVAADSKELLDIALTSRRLVSNMNEIIWSLNAEGRTLEHLFAYLRENLNKLLEYSGIEYSIVFPEQVPVIALSNEQRRNLLLIVKEAANNAVKYSKAANICITATLTPTTLGFTITDDGVGFNIAQQQAGNGLKNLRKRTADLAGHLEIISAEQKGTTVSISIPLKSHFVTGK